MENNQKIYLYILIFMGLLVVSCSKSDPIPKLTTSNTGPYIYNLEGLSIIKSETSNSFLQQELHELLEKADHFLLQNDFQFVTDKYNPAPSGNKNDYMSLHRYTVRNDEGSYVMGDYQINPQIQDYDRPKLAVLSDAVHTLSLAFFYTDAEQYATKASELLRAWFFEPETKMNPNLNFAQVNLSPQGDSTRGGAQGIIDTNDFIALLEAVSVLYDSASWTPEDHVNLKKWFYEFTLWINGKNSIIGSLSPDLHCVENYCNNVGSWADLQKAIYYLFTEQENLINSSRHIQPISTKIQRQFTAEGRQLYESRGLSQHYYYYNLRALVQLMTLRKNRTGFDRDWEYLTTNELTGFKNALGNISYFLETGDPQSFFEVEPGFNNCRYLEIFRPAAHLFESSEYESVSRHLIETGCSHPNITLVFPAYNPIVQQLQQ